MGSETLTLNWEIVFAYAAGLMTAFWVWVTLSRRNR